MNAKEKVKLFKKIFSEAGIDKKKFERIEDKCIAMSHLGFPQKDIINKLYEEDIILAEAIGLLHDIGRFEQIRTYHTFIDKDSVESEQDRFNLANILEQYDIDLDTCN